MAIPFIPQTKMPIDTFTQSLDQMFANMRAHQQQAIQRKQLEDAMKRHAEDMVFKKHADARAGAAAGRNAALFVERLKKLKSENAMEDFFNQAFFGGGMGGAGGGMGGAGNSMGASMQHEGAGSQQEGMENPNTGILGGEHQVDMQGNPSGGQQSFVPPVSQRNQAPEQNAPEQQPGQESPMVSALKAKMRQNPALRGAFHKKFGYDLLAETPEQKRAATQANELEIFKKKEEIKAQNKKGNEGEVPLTTAMKTSLQGVVNGVDNSLPILEELVKDFKNLPTGTETFNPSAYAAYNAKVNSIIEPLINAFGLNVTDATKEMMHEQAFRKTNEPLEKYRNRLIDLAKDIIRRRNDAFGSLKTGQISPKSEFTKEFFDKLAQETKVIDGKTYYKINGEWHE